MLSFSIMSFYKNFTLELSCYTFFCNAKNYWFLLISLSSICDSLNSRSAVIISLARCCLPEALINSDELLNTLFLLYCSTWICRSRMFYLLRVSFCFCSYFITVNMLVCFTWFSYSHFYLYWDFSFSYWFFTPVTKYALLPVHKL